MKLYYLHHKSNMLSEKRSYPMGYGYQLGMHEPIQTISSAYFQNRFNFYR